MLSTGEEIRSPQRSSRSGPILAKMPCTIKPKLNIVEKPENRVHKLTDSISNGALGDACSTAT